MDDFQKWMQGLGKEQAVPVLDDLTDLSEHNQDIPIQDWTYPCRVCGNECEIWCDPGEFNPDMHYCGGSPRCCP